MIEQPSTGEQPVAWSISYAGELANFYRTEAEAVTAYAYLTKKYGAVKHRLIVPLCTRAEVAALRAENERLKDRLEWSEHGYDGIACRDATIKLVDGANERLRTKLAESGALLAVAVEALGKYVTVYDNGVGEIAKNAITKIEGVQKK